MCHLPSHFIFLFSLNLLCWHAANQYHDLGTVSVLQIDPSGGLVPPSPEFQTSSRAATPGEINGTEELLQSTRDTREEESRRGPSHSRSPSHRVRLSALEDSQAASAKDGDISTRRAESELLFDVGDECEVLISDSDMVSVGLLPSLLDVELVSGAAATTLAPKSEDSAAHPTEIVSAKVVPGTDSSVDKETSGGVNGDDSAVPPPENVAGATKTVSPTYGPERGQNWVEGVVIAVRPNGTVDLFLPSSVHKRYLKPMLLQQPRERLRKKKDYM